MLKNRLIKLEKKLALPGPAPVVIIDEGDSVPVGAQVVIVDDITEWKDDDDPQAYRKLRTKD